jgi:formate dehydrogenase maturation protein FdhE
VVQPGDGSPGYGLTDAVAGLEALIGQPHISEDYVRFRIDLLQAQGVVRAASERSSPIAERRRDGKPRTPALEAKTVRFDGELLAALCDALCEAVTRSGRDAGDVPRLAAAVKEEPGLLGELVRGAAFGPDQEFLESLSSRLDTSTDALLFVGRVLAAPFVAVAARRAGETSAPAAGAAGRCGVCGSPPALAMLAGEEGKRTLFCSLCGRSYAFKRLACPHCGNDETGTLGFVRPSESDPRWIETCDKCKRYIKTIDTRKLPDRYPLIPIVEEAATLHLDLLAEREGCARGLPYAACV